MSVFKQTDSLFSLNPSYDTTTEWVASCFSNTPSEFLLQHDESGRYNDSTKSLRRLMTGHNKNIEDENEALLRLINLSKKVFGMCFGMQIS